MKDESDDISARIEALRANRASGASELLSDAIAVLATARAARTNVLDVARAVCQAQPAMAAIWNAAIAAVASEQDPDRFAQFVERARRAPAAMVRFATAHFSPGARPSPPTSSSEGGRIVTISFSGSVLAVLKAIRSHRPLRVACSESRPALEGRRLAAELAGAGLPVTLFSDASLGHALADAEAVLVGADAIGPTSFLNKSGTRMLAAAAALQGVPVYVIATREKFVSEALAIHLVIRGGDPVDIWEAPPPGVEVRNPYFEPTPLDLVTAVITDVGVLGAGMVPDLCASLHDEVALRALGGLT